MTREHCMRLIQLHEEFAELYRDMQKVGRRAPIRKPPKFEGVEVDDLTRHESKRFLESL